MPAGGVSQPGLYGIFRYETNLRPPFIAVLIAELDFTSGLSSGVRISQKNENKINTSL